MTEEENRGRNVPNRQPGRRSVRLRGYDYARAGGYFVTVVTLRRECLFGEISAGGMRVNALGEIVQECWDEVPLHFAHVSVDAFVVMPNHVHGILFIHDDGRGTIYRAPTSTIGRFGKPTAGSLSTVIRTYKAAVTRRAGRELNTANIWQRNYYEHILRNNADYQRIADYIVQNPHNWAADNENRPLP